MTVKQGLTIKIPVEDWNQEFLQEEPNLTGENSLIDLRLQGVHPAKIGRLAIIARERGVAPDDILPANKLLLNTGAALEISTAIAARKRTVETADGKEIEVREFVAPVREEEEGHHTYDNQDNSASPSPLPDNTAIISVLSDTARARALDYLLKIVPGYVYGRLAIIAVNGGDVAAAADSLKGKIDEMVERLG